MLTERKVSSSEPFQTVLMLMPLPSSGRTVDLLKKEFAKLWKKKKKKTFSVNYAVREAE